MSLFKSINDLRMEYQKRYARYLNKHDIEKIAERLKAGGTDEMET